MRNLWSDFIESHTSQIARCILNSEKLKWEKMGIMESMKDTNAKFLNTPQRRNKMTHSL